ncbi:hypothetical protein [Rhizobium sullae]|uniref:Uncharacterized protein n=1 Tax=Rhizobium sullae TaxID=50338 RepID=A0A4V2V8J5_RHISU|nr:hypothetical protein EV132_112204 [Rhizobium sullae]
MVRCATVPLGQRHSSARPAILFEYFRKSVGENGVHHDPVPPTDDIASSIKENPHLLCLERPKLAVLNVVFAAPDHLDWTAFHFLGRGHGVYGEIGFRLTAEAAADHEQG